MNVGNLVRITRLSIGVPAGAIGLIMKSSDTDAGYKVYDVQFIGSKAVYRRYLARDLVVISESR